MHRVGVNSTPLIVKKAIDMYSAKEATLEKAADLAGLSVWDFVELLKKYNVPWGEYTEDGLNMDKITLANCY